MRVGNYDAALFLKIYVCYVCVSLFAPTGVLASPAFTESCLTNKGKTHFSSCSCKYGFKAQSSTWSCCQPDETFRFRREEVMRTQSFLDDMAFVFPPWLDMSTLESDNMPCIKSVNTFQTVYYKYILEKSKPDRHQNDVQVQANNEIRWIFDRVDPCSAYPTSATKPARCAYINQYCGIHKTWECDSQPHIQARLIKLEMQRNGQVYHETSETRYIQNKCCHQPDLTTSIVAQHIKTLCRYTDTESVLTHAPFKQDFVRAVNYPNICGAGVATSVPKRMECCTGGELWTQNTNVIKNLCYKSVGKPTDPPATWKCHDKSPTDTYWDPWLNNDPSNGGVHLITAEKTAKAEECCNYDKPNTLTPTLTPTLKPTLKPTLTPTLKPTDTPTLIKGLGGGNCAKFSTW